ncbi:methyltransferase type 11 [Sorangium cellulosum]|uniref:Methyltransferase type 11 n=1 Tax=Sorangium cellulosum TaxID=56 RepID=A0A150PUI2_SORCE|nr:methyltransferase type 11 [Sorangium cellulosum]
MSDERNFPDWQELYRSTPAESMPWYHEALDPDLERALERLEVARGRALDLGTGPGTQAFALAERGFDVTGSDLSHAAVEQAAAKAAQRGLAARFLQDDILDSKLDGPFDVVFDRGCFHCLPPARRADYVRTLKRLVAPGGHVFLKCFSVLEPFDQGPYRFTPAELREIFGADFDVLSAEETVYHGPREPPPRALFAVLKPR